LLKYKDGVSNISVLPGCGHWSANMNSCDHKRRLQKRETTKRWGHKHKWFLKLFDLFPTANFHRQKGAALCCNMAVTIRPGSVALLASCPSIKVHC